MAIRQPTAARRDDAGPDPRAGMCKADTCPLPGSLSNGHDYWCAFHFGALGTDIPRVTSILFEHKPVTDALVEALVMSRDRPTDVASHKVHIATARARLERAGYTLRSEDGPKRDRMDLSRWAYVLAALLGSFVQQVHTARPRRSAVVETQPLPLARPASDFVRGPR